VIVASLSSKQKVIATLLSQMSSGATLFRSVRFGQTEDVTKRRQARFQIQLRRLREVGLLSEKVELE